MEIQLPLRQGLLFSKDSKMIMSCDVVDVVEAASIVERRGYLVPTIEGVRVLKTSNAGFHPRSIEIKVLPSGSSANGAIAKVIASQIKDFVHLRGWSIPEYGVLFKLHCFLPVWLAFDCFPGAQEDYTDTHGEWVGKPHTMLFDMAGRSMVIAPQTKLLEVEWS